MWDLPVLDALKTGQNIRKLRVEAGFSVPELTEAIGLRSPKILYKWESGESLPTLARVLQLADVFGVKVEDIIVRVWNGKAV